ncbi:acyl-CoA carboxylase subunit epsilon [Streptomyces tauricus]|uniref:acyl-CoA carboxylase subunit epsilon n=2 Tax=Streptomyces tauricus TaxID=68274 RepID=UPI0022443916|nr:acyl-CoA carboxylase subunit epsilon [Streptomyces tauricus]MCW8096841.1 acyl-CoA carboxylase subunit epsilon [Streptomyces tauricus]
MTAEKTMDPSEIPLLTFVRGAPTDEEVAAVLAVVRGRVDRPAPDEPARTGGSPRWAQTQAYRTPRAWTSR